VSLLLHLLLNSSLAALEDGKAVLVDLEGGDDNLGGVDLDGAEKKEKRIEERGNGQRKGWKRFGGGEVGGGREEKGSVSAT
jgi:hypothetical protein